MIHFLNLKTLLFACLYLLILPVSAQQYLWVDKIGSNTVDEGKCITTDTFGNLYTTGFFRGTVDFDPGSGVFNLTSNGNLHNVFVSKLDVSGNFVWAKSFGGSGGSSSSDGFSLVISPSGSIYVTGSFTGTIDFDPDAGVVNHTSAGFNDIFICKLNSSGSLVWVKRIGGVSGEQGNSIDLDASGNIYTTGYFYSTVDFDPGAGTFDLTSAGLEDIFISKLDSSGVFIWATRIGGIKSDLANAIAIDPSGNIYTAGYFKSTVDFNPGSGTFNLVAPLTGTYDGFVCKLNPSGGFLWVYQIGASPPPSGEGYSANSIAIDATGNAYVTGKVWESFLNPNTGLVVFTQNVFIYKMGLSGGVIWSKNIRSPIFAQGNSIDLDALGNVYTTGYFEGTADFDPGAGTFSLTSAGDRDVFISKLNPSGDFLGAKKMGGANRDFGASIKIGSNAIVYTTGAFSLTSDFDPGSGVSNLISSGSTDIFIHATCNYDIILSSPQICVGNDLIITANSVPGASYNWTGPNGFTSTSQSPIIPAATLQNNGLYMVTVNDGCSSIESINIAIPPSPVVNANSNGPVCAGQTLNLTANSSGSGSTYTWTGPNNFYGINTEPDTLIYNSTTAASGAYILAVEDSNGCQNSDTITIVVNALPTLIITALADTICSGESVTLYFSGANTYFAFGPVSGVPFVPSMTGTYTVIGTDINGCTDTLTKEIFVRYLPGVGISSTDISCSGCNDGVAMSYGYGGTSPYSYLWNNNASTQNISNLTAGNYSVLVTDANNCSDTASVNIAEYVEPPAPVGKIIAAGGYHSIYRCSGGQANAVGKGDDAQLGNGTWISSPTPILVSGLTGITAVAAGEHHSVFVKNDGTVWACGQNGPGQLGDGTTIDKSIPVQAIGLTGIVAAAGGRAYSLFLKNDGTVWAVGSNVSGQFGDGTIVSQSTPIQIVALTGIIEVATGAYHSLFLKNDGTVWAVGDNYYGQLGDGTTIDKLTPVQVSGLSGITAISAGGGSHSLFLKNDGTVWAVGDNWLGQLGDGTGGDVGDYQSTAVQVSGLSEITAVSAGWGHSLFLKSDGTVWSVGGNQYSQLGDGTTTDQSVPVQVNALTGIIAISAGGNHSLFLKNDNTVWAVGKNSDGGQLGDGTTINKSTPVQVTGLCSIGVGIENNSIENNISIYPNPSSGHLKIKIHDLSILAESSELNIYNAIGDSIYRVKINSSTTEIDFSSKAKGIYFYQIRNERAILKTGKILMVD